jgi:lysozyme
MPTLTDGAEHGANKAVQPFDYSHLKYGIDVSHYQGNIDWEQVRKGGILSPVKKTVEFAFIKITQGSEGRDPMSTINALGATAAGIPWGPYHFCTLDRNDVIADATAEAEYLAKRLVDLPAYQLPIMLDTELDDKNVKLSAEQFEDWIRTFFNRLTQAGHADFILYSYSSYLNTHLKKNHSLGNIRLVVADYNGDYQIPNGWSRAWMRQFSATGKVSGITTGVDLDVLL